jgi:hypothetical protein
MAVAIAGGLFGATLLTLLVLPTMYAAWFKVQASNPPQIIPSKQNEPPDNLFSPHL